ncbi:MAG: type II toxin-antitoxin system RelE/ParE family toxin [Methanobrevibacter sp.]|nr:type II toxin-antitoxin system RelE/ParE family toxin [Methanobrevibacter sp.]
MILKKDMGYEIVFNRKSDKYLIKLSKKDKINLKFLLDSIKELSKNPYASEILKSGKKKERKIRKKDYRIFFIINENLHQIEIINIGKRSNIYKKI